MKLAYLDEAGCTGMLPSASSPIQPVFVVGAILVDADRLGELTEDFLRLKRKFFPRAVSADADHLDWIRMQVKGSELRKDAAASSHRKRRAAFGVVDGIMRLLEGVDAALLARVWVKGIGANFDGRAVYTYSVQDLCRSFQACLEHSGDEGLVIADSRAKPKNAQVAHSIFTQKFQSRGDPLNRLIEMPTFGHSENHAGLQLAVLACSALLFPIAVHVYCNGRVRNLHVRPGYAALHQRYASRLRRLQFRFHDPVSGRWRGGIILSDGLGRDSARSMLHP